MEKSESLISSGIRRLFGVFGSATDLNEQEKWGRLSGSSGGVATRTSYAGKRVTAGAAMQLAA